MVCLLFVSRLLRFLTLSPTDPEQREGVIIHLSGFLKNYIFVAVITSNKNCSKLMFECILYGRVGFELQGVRKNRCLEEKIIV